MKWLCFFLVYIGCLLEHKHATAQCPSVSQFGTQWVAGAFGIRGTEVGSQCTGRAVALTTPNTVTNAKYIYDYKNRSDTAKATAATTYIYTLPGPYYIVQLGTVNGRPSMSCNLVQVYATTQPIFTLSTGCDAAVKMNISTAGQIYGRYLIDWGDGKPPQVYLPNQPPPTYTYATNGTYQIKVAGEGTLALQDCNAVSEPQVFESVGLAAPIANGVVTVQDNAWNKITLSLAGLPTGIKNFSFGFNGQEIQKNSAVLTDSTAQPAKNQTCYQVSYRDACDRQPTTAPTLCSIYAQNEGETLRWSAQSPFVGAVAGYMVEKVGASGQVLGSYDVGLATTWTADVNDTDQTVVYRVRATATNGQTSISNTVLLVRVVSLFIPNGFSPNNDQINDVFELKGQFIEKGAVTIFDRWGNVLYHTNDWQKGWDGKDAKGQNVAGGFYAYRVVYTDGKKNDYTKTGTVYLVR